MAATQPNRYGRRRGRGIRPWLIATKLTGVAFVVGGLASMAAIGLFGRQPETLEGWSQLRHTLKAPFLLVLFTGFALAIVSGIVLWLQMPRAFLRMRWFRAKVLAIAFGIPGMHFYARSRMMRFDEALEAGRLEDLSALWRDVALAFLVGVGVFLIMAIVARIKPRVGQPIAPAKKAGDSTDS